MVGGLVKFISHQSLRGLGRTSASQDVRKPVTIRVLSKLIGVLRQVCSSRFEEILFYAIFVTAFIVFLFFFRVNEFVANSHSDMGRASSSLDVCISCKGVEVLLKHSKTDQIGKGTLILLPRVKAGICPVKAISDYMRIRPKSKGLFFVLAMVCM
jgi:hypothetical protein